MRHIINKLIDTEEPTLVTVSIFPDERIHMPFTIDSKQLSNKMKLLVKVYKGSETPVLDREYYAAPYYITHFIKLLRKEGIYFCKNRIVFPEHRKGLRKMWYILYHGYLYK